MGGWRGRRMGALLPASCTCRIDGNVGSGLDPRIAPPTGCMGSCFVLCSHEVALVPSSNRARHFANNTSIRRDSLWEPGRFVHAGTMAHMSSAALRAPGGRAAAAQRRQQPRAAVASRPVALAAQQAQLLSAVAAGPGSGHRCVLTPHAACCRCARHGPAEPWGAAPATQPPPCLQALAVLRPCT